MTQPPHIPRPPSAPPLVAVAREAARVGLTPYLYRQLMAELHIRSTRLGSRNVEYISATDADVLARRVAPPLWGGVR